MRGVKILGIGHYCPENIVTNKDLESVVETTDEWIIKRTGIKERRISSGEGTVDLAYKAAINALNNSNCSKDDIDLIIVATTSPDKLMPSTACSIQGLLKNIQTLSKLLIYRMLLHFYILIIPEYYKQLMALTYLVKL